MWFLALIAVAGYLAYQRFSLLITTILLASCVVIYTLFGHGNLFVVIPLWLMVLLIALLNVDVLRIRFSTRHTR